MKKAFAALLVAGLLAAIAIWFSRPPARRSAGDLQLHKLAEDVYVYRGVFSASGVIVTPASVVVVDSQVAPMAARRLRSEIARVTPLPVTHVINTHYHGDHVGGNAEFPGAEILASEETARLVRERDGERVEYAKTFGLAFQEVHAVAPPTRTFSGRMTLVVGGETLELMQLGRVETPDAIVVWWPARRVVFTGDGVATHDYPWTGVPFLDEGLQPDGEWISYLGAVKALRPTLLVPGHGPALAGEAEIAARLDLLAALFGDLFQTARPLVARGLPVPELVEQVDAQLAHYRERADLEERVVSQRFAIYKAVNGLSPERRGKGWWHDFRPSIVPAELRRELDQALAARDAAALGRLADACLARALDTRPYVDATELFVASSTAARAALAEDPGQAQALLALGSAEVWGGMVLAQSMAPAVEKLERAVAGDLDGAQARWAAFFLGKAHQMEGRDEESDRWYRRVLPWPLRWAFPFVRERLRATP